jgi:hypothetical protein
MKKGALLTIRPVLLTMSLAATTILAPAISTAGSPPRLLANVTTSVPAEPAASTTRPIAIAPAGAQPSAADAAAAVGDESHTTSIGGLRLPGFIGPLEYIGAQSGADRHTMATYSYRAMGLALDIHVTDLGAGGITDGIESADLTRRYVDAKKTLVAATGVRGLEPNEATVALGQDLARVAAEKSDDTRRAREAIYRLKREGEGGTTYLWFTAAHGLVIDARFDVALGFEEDGDIGRGEILAMLGKAIPETSAAVVQARARANAADDAAVKLAILWDPETPEEESKIWLAYLFARGAYAANETAGGPAVGERESTFDEEVRGRMIALVTFRALKREAAQPTSAYFNDIDRVDAAGFLREYVWSYLRHPAWTRTPEGLDLAAFNAWRDEHLADHKVVTHGRIAFRLASAK